MKLPIVSIIVPVFNAANHIGKCLESLQSQTYRFLEIIFINDCSQDISGIVLETFKEHISRLKPAFSIKILQHNVNRGVAAARNTGLSEVTGEYIYYLDADDFLADNCIELLVDKAISSNSDIVGCNWILQFDKNGRIMTQPFSKTPIQAIECMCKGVMRWNLWLFLVRKDLYDKYDIKFIPDNNMGEDMMVMFKLLLHANNISMVKAPLYYYTQSNSASLTKTYSTKHKEEVMNNMLELDKYFKVFGGEINFNLIFNLLKLNIKLPLLISNSSQQYAEWLSWFPESNSYSLRNDLISIRIKMLQFMACKKQYWFLRLHYFLVIKVIYGIVYK